MKVAILGIVAALMLITPSSFAQEAKSASVTIPAGTEIGARLANELDSGQLHAGDPVILDVLEDLKIGNVVAVPRGAIVTGRVTEAKGARRMGRGGQLDVSFESVTAGDGTKVPVTGDRAAKGKGGYGAGSATGAVAAGLFFPPAGALLLLKHGHASVIPAGAILTVDVTADTTVAGVPAIIAAPAAVPARVLESSERHLTVVSVTDSATPQLAISQSESLGDAARRYREQRAAEQQASKP